MKYLGSKTRIAKEIIHIMLKKANEKNLTKWAEPFIGGGNMMEHVPDNFERFGADLNPHTIAALTFIRDQVDALGCGVVTPEYYAQIKGSAPNPFTSWLRFVCCFAGKFESGFARDAQGRDYAAEALRSALKQQPKMQSVELFNGCYSLLELSDYIIYCDPPYKGRTGYKTGAFDHSHFFEWCRTQARKGNVIYVSEYEAPSDFQCVWSKTIKTNFSLGRESGKSMGTEKLFLLEY